MISTSIECACMLKIIKSKGIINYMNHMENSVLHNLYHISCIILLSKKVRFLFYDIHLLSLTFCFEIHKCENLFFVYVILRGLILLKKVRDFFDIYLYFSKILRFYSKRVLFSYRQRILK